jgi:hypothetical protein
MRRSSRVYVLVVVIALCVMALGVVPASADVHPVAQAACAPTGIASGAIGSRHAIANGRPAAPIMITASPFVSTSPPFNSNFPGFLNSKAEPLGTNC